MAGNTHGQLPRLDSKLEGEKTPPASPTRRRQRGKQRLPNTTHCVSPIAPPVNLVKVENGFLWVDCQSE
jgi:hypothetical protein